MCSLSKIINPGQMLPGANNSVINPSSMITKSTNRFVNPWGPKLMNSAKDEPSSLLAGGGVRVNGEVTRGTTLLGS